MERVEAFKVLVEIKRIIYDANIFVENELDLSVNIVEELTKLGDMAALIEAYILMNKDKELIDEVERIDSGILHQINGWCNINQSTKISLLSCARSLYDIAHIRDHETRTDKEKQHPPLEIDAHILQVLQEYKFIEAYTSLPINWKSTHSELNSFINMLFNDTDNKWDRALSTFVKKGIPIKKHSLTTSINKGNQNTRIRELEKKSKFKKNDRNL